MSGKKLYKIGKIAQAAGVPCSTVRYYSTRGLLEVSGYTSGGYRLFELEKTIKRIKEIRDLTGPRLTLDEVKQQICEINNKVNGLGDRV